MNLSSHKGEIAVIFHSPRGNQYGLNVLAGALGDLEAKKVCSLFFSRNICQTDNLIKSLMPNFGIILVCWSFMSTEFQERKAEVEFLRQRFAGYPIKHIAGGPHPAASPKETLQQGWDIVATGEGEEIIRMLIKAFLGSINFESISGIAWKEGQVVKINGKAPLVNLDLFPPFCEKHKRFNPIEITRGCIYACKFCQTPFLFKAYFRHRSIEMVKEAVKTMRQYGLKDVRFITPSALSYGASGKEVSIECIESLLATVKETLGHQGRIFFGSFPSEVRPEHINPYVLRILKQFVANDNLVIGAQSGSERILKLAGRQHTPEHAKSAVRYTLEAGFKANVDIIVGMPEETEEDQYQTIKFIEELVAMGAKIHAHVFMPLPGTPWEHKKPAPISEKLLYLFGKLSAAGLLYGSWRNQINIAKELSSSQSEIKFKSL